jgi:hypothetical protein
MTISALPQHAEYYMILTLFWETNCREIRGFVSRLAKEFSSLERDVVCTDIPLIEISVEFRVFELNLFQ